MHVTRPTRRFVMILGFLTASIGPSLKADPAGKPSPKSKPSRKTPDAPVDSSGAISKGSLRMSRAVACRTIDGYEQYEPLEIPELTSDEKLLVYYRPEGYKVVRRDRNFVVHFSQDGKVRRKGEKAVLRTKKNLLDLETPFKSYPGALYLRNLVSLKDLPPGDYEFDIILRDENAPGQTATQTLPFRIVRVATVPKESTPDPRQ